MTSPREFTFKAVRHRYADGTVYNIKRYDIMVDTGPEGKPYFRACGGVLVMEGKALAFIGATSISAKEKDILAYSDVFEWGTDIRDALAKLKPAIAKHAQERWS